VTSSPGGTPPLLAFDPADGVVIRSPERPETGYWAGAPSVLADGDVTWLTYRERRPRGAPAERGWRCAVAVSRDGIGFDDVWEVHKDELATASMERFDLIRTAGGYELLLSFVDPADGRWRIDAVRATRPDAFDVADRRPVLTAASTGTEGVKDPVVVELGGLTHLFASVAAPGPGVDASAHASADVYNTGATTHPTGVATRGTDGFTWRGEALAVGPGGSWDGYQARLGAIIPAGDGWLGLYDGSAGHEENYEERLGLAWSPDGRVWRRETPRGPWLIGPGPTGSIRYADVVVRDGAAWIYHEVTRPDGAHELRLARAPIG
jgi:hypothetical protein